MPVTEDEDVDIEEKPNGDCVRVSYIVFIKLLDKHILI